MHNLFLLYHKQLHWLSHNTYITISVINFAVIKLTLKTSASLILLSLLSGNLTFELVSYQILL